MNWSFLNPLFKRVFYSWQCCWRVLFASLTNMVSFSISLCFNFVFIIALFAAIVKQVRWIRVLYSNFSAFTKDQEFLISLHGQPSTHKFDYVEGFVIVDEGLINNWRSSFFSPSNPVKITSINSQGGVLYCLEITKNYHESTADTIDQVLICIRVIVLLIWRLVISLQLASNQSIGLISPTSI